MNGKSVLFLKILAFLFTFAGVCVYLFSAEMTFVKWLPLIIGLVLLAVLSIFNITYISSTVSSRSFKYTTNAIIYALIVVSIIGVLNFIAAKQTTQWDLTKNKRYTLSDQSVKILKSLKEDINILMFYSDLEKPLLTDLLKQYAYHNEKFKFEFIDINKKPHIAEQNQVKAPRTAILKYKGQVEKLYGMFGEQEFTNALIRVSRPGKKSVYFLTGHGEADPDGMDAKGMSAVKTGLADLNFNVAKLNLIEKQEVPKDCQALVVAGPVTELMAPEEAAISKYLNEGGHAFFMVDPKPAFGCETFLKNYGFEIGTNLVIDSKPALKALGFGDYTIPLCPVYDPGHEITKNFTIATFMPYARSVTPAITPQPGSRMTALVKTSPDSFADTTYLTNPNIKFDQNIDVKGPITVIAACAKALPNINKNTDTSENALKSDADAKKSKETEMRIVVAGTSKAARNQYVNLQGNGNLMLNIINYLAEEEDLIAIKPKTSPQAKIDMTAQDASNIFYLTLFLMPAVVIMSGFTVWFYRNR